MNIGTIGGILIEMRCFSTAGWKVVKWSSAVSDTAAADTEKLASFIFSKQRMVCITGAGISTRSGIPDYRGPNGSYSKGHRPMMHKDFVTKELARKRYWSRSIIGFKEIFKAQPNEAHKALTRLQQQGIIRAIITQNVDGLHQKSGTDNVVDLHGRLDSVSCLSCGCKQCRSLYQDELERLNQAYLDAKRSIQVEPGLESRPDGDINLGDIDVSNFSIPPCGACGGVLKPDVVFFGDNVPKESKDKATEEVENSDGLLVVGTSLEVFSAFRLIRRAIELQRPIAVINIGATRLHRIANELKSDPVALSSPILFVDADCADILQQVVSRIP